MSRREHLETSLNREPPIGLECEGEYRDKLQKTTEKFLGLLWRERHCPDLKDSKKGEA